MNNHYFLLVSLLALFITANDSLEQKRTLIYEDQFDEFDSAIWKAEIDPIPESRVEVKNGKLVLDTKGGVTVWLNKLLKGNIQIEYTRKVVVKGDTNDRLSDLNQFWMADLTHTTPFNRNGKFESYDSLRLYYAGIGGNSNTTTRFRKYNGDGERTLLQEFIDKEHLLQPNVEYRIKIVVKDKTTSLWMNDKLYFSYEDPEILNEGYFGFRSTYSHQEIDNFRVYKLD